MSSVTWSRSWPGKQRHSGSLHKCYWPSVVYTLSSIFLSVFSVKKCVHFLLRRVCVEPNWHFGINFGFHWSPLLLVDIYIAQYWSPALSWTFCCTLYVYLAINYFGTLLHICWFTQNLFNGVYRDVWSLKRWNTFFCINTFYLDLFLNQSDMIQTERERTSVKKKANSSSTWESAL